MEFNCLMQNISSQQRNDVIVDEKPQQKRTKGARLRQNGVINFFRVNELRATSDLLV